MISVHNLLKEIYLPCYCYCDWNVASMTIQSIYTDFLVRTMVSCSRIPSLRPFLFSYKWLNGITCLSNILYRALLDDTTHTQNIHGQVIFHRPKTPGYVPQQRLGQHPANVAKDMTKDGWSATVYLALNQPETITPHTEAKLHIWTGEVVLSWGGHHSLSSWSQAQRLLQRTSVDLAFLYL